MCLALTATAGAQASAVTVGGTAVVTTDYVYRGLTQSEGRVAFQLDGHLQSASGWFLGAWGSFAGSAPPRGSRSEVNLYLGRTWVVSPDWTATAHYARYLYPDDRSWVRYYYDDYDEIQAAASYQDRATLSVGFSPRVQRYGYGPIRGRGRQLSYEASFRQPVWHHFSVTGGAGYYDLSDVFGRSYWAFRAGAELTVRHLTLSLSRFDVDGNGRHLFGSQAADGSWAVTAAWGF